MATVRKGIVGINVLRKDNPAGWHVFVGKGETDANAYQGYRHESFLSILADTPGEFIDWQGNNLFFIAP